MCLRRWEMTSTVRSRIQTGLQGRWEAFIWHCSSLIALPFLELACRGRDAKHFSLQLLNVKSVFSLLTLAGTFRYVSHYSPVYHFSYYFFHYFFLTGVIIHKTGFFLLELRTTDILRRKDPVIYKKYHNQNSSFLVMDMSKQLKGPSSSQDWGSPQCSFLTALPLGNPIAFLCQILLLRQSMSVIMDFFVDMILIPLSQHIV